MEQIYYNVELNSAGTDILSVIKAYRDMTGIGLKDAKDIIDSAPSIILKTSVLEEAEHYKAVLESCGAVVNICSANEEISPIEADFPKKLRKVGFGFIILNIAVSAVMGAVIAFIIFYLRHVFYFSFFLLCTAVITELCILHNYYGNKLIDSFVNKTIVKNTEKYSFDNAYTFHYQNLTVMIDLNGGRVAYISNLYPYKFQIISAKDIFDIGFSYRKDILFQHMTNYVYFQFSYHGKLIKIPTFSAKNPLPVERLSNSFETAERFSLLLRSAKEIAVSRDIKNQI